MHKKPLKLICKPPRNGRRRLAANGLKSLQHIRLDLAESELELPALVVEAAEFGRRVGLRVYERRQDRRRSIAFALKANRAGYVDLREARVLLAGFSGDLKLHEFVAGASTATRGKPCGYEPGGHEFAGDG